MKLKTKLSIGVLFLFIVILVFGVLGVFFINKLSKDASNIIKNNHESLVYCNSMLKALEDTPFDSDSKKRFDSSLRLQENNITEVNEKEATVALRKNFDRIAVGSNSLGDYSKIRQNIQLINDLNQQAILIKNEIASKNADEAKLWLSGIFCILIIVTLTFSVNFPAIISSPVAKLNEGIRDIANKNYNKRIFIDQKDEFGDLAQAFNNMAEKLDEYEHSNLAQLRFEKSRIETVINQMKDAVIGLDEHKRILFLNDVAAQLLGITEAEIIGIYAPNIALHNDLMRTLLTEEDKYELKIFAGNKESYFSKEQVDVTSSNKIIGHVIVLKNITPFHELNEAKTNFIATVSHELKTPISSIKMSAKLLNDPRIGNLNNEQTELIENITGDAERLLKITSELLNLSQAETGHIQMKMQPCAVKSIVEESVLAVVPKARQREIAIVSEVPAELPMINADLEKTSWVLINLLTNAIKYSPEKSSVYVSVYQKDQNVVFEVKDSGRGIEEQHLSQIFNRYFKGPASNEKNDTGLGLAISKEFIEGQNGTITAKSNLGLGSIFSFSFLALS